MGVLDDPLGFGNFGNAGIDTGFGIESANGQRAPQSRRVPQRFGVYFIQNGLRRSRTFKSLQAAERFKVNAKNIEGVTQVSEVFQL